MCVGVITEGRGVRDGQAGAPGLSKTPSPPPTSLGCPASAWLEGHNRPQPFKCKLDGGKRWKRGNELDLSIGGVQLEKVSISY